MKKLTAAFLSVLIVFSALQLLMTESFAIDMVIKPVIDSAKNEPDGICLRYHVNDRSCDEMRVYRKEGNGDWSRVYRDNMNCYYFECDSSFKDKNVTPGKTYTYRIKSYDDGKCLQTCETDVSVKRLAAVDITTSKGKGGVLIKWKKATGAAGYKIFRKRSGSSSWDVIATVFGLQYTDTEMQINTLYTYKVRAYSGRSLGAVNMYSGAYYAVKFSAPKLKSVTNAQKGVCIKWAEIPSAGHYRIYRKAAGETSWKLVGKTGELSFVDEKATTGTKYTYTVRVTRGGAVSFDAFDPKGMSVYYVKIPSIIKFSANPTSLSFTWQKVEGVSGYRIYRKTFNTKYVKIATVKANANLRYTDKTVKCGERYYYAVEAYVGNNNSSIISRNYTFLSMPELKSTQWAKTGVKVTWGAVGNATHYNIFRRTPDTKNWEKIEMVKGENNTTFIDKTADKNTTYYYTVRAETS